MSTYTNIQCTERLYQIEHPRVVSLFDEVSPLDEGDFGYWISKTWLKGAYVVHESAAYTNHPTLRLEINEA